MTAVRSSIVRISSTRLRLLMAALLAVSFLGALDHTIVSTSLATVAGELGALQHMSWVVVGYTLASTVLLPVLGGLGDRVGPRMVFLIALIGFVAASFVCGLAHDMTQLVVARVLQGMSAAGLQLMSQTIVAEVTTPRQRPAYLSLIGAAFPVAILIGPLLGGLITDHWGWPWVFWINVPVGLAALLLAVVAVPHIEPAGKKRFDVVGAVLLTAVLVAVVLAVAWFSSGNSAAWIALGAGVAALGGLVVVERGQKNPIIPVHLFRNRTFSAGVGLSAVMGAGLISATAYLPTYFQMAYGVSATISGLVPIATVLGMLVGNLVTGWLASRTGRYRVFPIIGTVMGAVGLGAMSLLPGGAPLWVPALIMAFVGLGTGAFMSLAIAIVQGAAPRSELGAATATAGLSGQIGSTVGSAVVGGVVGFGVASLLPAGLDSHTLTPALVHAADPVLQAEIAAIYHDVFSPVFLALAGVYILGFIAALLLPDGRLSDDAAGSADTAAMDDSAGLALQGKD
ncbi:Drug resistance transporter, EmrB/QacA subfamily [Arthrobacter sp. 9V]|uniref:MFS transporter n=1 Tax=Arthrobacter sp. 9V TaxID=2653132 RepID=UPI0012F34911|nr:MFS transporter [Arthrobacter sp. 9V]VXC33468.1 Drug resistance transporter, EmrB/QacA subfamily [Arthrobacter sp. 9V]